MVRFEHKKEGCMKNYEVVITGASAALVSLTADFKQRRYPRGFAYKGDAITHAREICDFLVKTTSTRWVQVKNCRTGQITHMLHRSRSSCRVCGNELEGKQHCPLCGALHSYM